MRLSGQFDDSDSVTRLLRFHFEFRGPFDGPSQVFIDPQPPASSRWVAAGVLVGLWIKALVFGVKLRKCGENSIEFFWLDAKSWVCGKQTFGDLLFLDAGAPLLKLDTR